MIKLLLSLLPSAIDDVCEVSRNSAKETSMCFNRKCLIKGVVLEPALSEALQYLHLASS